MSASIDTQVGTEIVPFQIKAKFNASFDLKTGESMGHLTQLHLQSNPSNMVKQKFDILMEDMLVPMDRFADVDSSTIERLISTVTGVNQARSKSTSLTYDDSINLSGMTSAVSVTLTGNLHANITGNGNNNVLTGNAGNNLLNGGTGRDLMAGGLGNDAYFVDNPGDKIIEQSAGGLDFVNSSVSYVLGRNLENLRLTSSTALSGRGNDLDNAIYGSDSRNYLYGGAGNDQLDGGLGNDRLSGGPGEDKFIFSTPLNATSNLDSITDFVSGQDQLILSPSVFANWTPGQLLVGSDWELNQHQFTANDRLIFNTSTQILSYDANGWGGRDGTPIAVLTGVFNLNSRDVAKIDMT
jgi:Ca2+-binding RTX toxin-like protein